MYIFQHLKWFRPRFSSSEIVLQLWKPWPAPAFFHGKSHGKSHWCHSLRKVRTSTVAEDVCCRETAQWRPHLSYLFNWELESQDVPGSKKITSKNAGFDWTTLVDSLNMSQIILEMWLWHCLNKTNQKWWCTASTFRNQGCKGWIIFKRPALRRSFHGLNTA